MGVALVVQVLENEINDPNLGPNLSGPEPRPELEI